MISIRVSTEDDLDAMTAIARRNRLVIDIEDWRHFWDSNPSRHAFEDMPRGWVLENDDREPVGAMLNVHMMYDFEGQALRGGLGSSAAIDPPYRNKSVLLIGKFLRQKEADFTIVGSANSAVAQLCNVIAKRIPSPDSDVPLLWPVDHAEFAAAVLKRKNVPAIQLLRIPVGLALRAADVVRRKGHAAKVRVDVINGFSDQFDEFWERLRRSDRRLRALRNRANLEWRFQKYSRAGTLRVLTARNSTELQGYLVLIRSCRGEFGFGVHEIVDLQAPGDNAGVIQALIKEALAVAKAEQSGMLKFRAWNTAKRAAAMELGPYTYRYPLWQAYYSGSNATLLPHLAQADVWDFSPFDIF